MQSTVRRLRTFRECASHRQPARVATDGGNLVNDAYRRVAMATERDRQDLFVSTATLASVPTFRAVEVPRRA